MVVLMINLDDHGDEYVDHHYSFEDDDVADNGIVLMTFSVTMTMMTMATTMTMRLTRIVAYW